MKKLLSISTLLLSFGLLTGCDKETDLIAKYETPTASQALLKINYVSAYAGNPSVQLKLNDIRVSNLITARTPFPGGGYNTGGGSANDYLAINPGSVPVSVSIPKRLTATDSVVLFTTTLNLEAGKNYSAHITDTSTNTKVLLLEDNLSQPDTGQTRFRFVNLMPNVPAVDLYYGDTKVVSNVAYLTSSPYITMPVPRTALAWSIREAGADPTSTALATYTSANTTLSTRVYTAMATGYKGLATTATGYTARRPYISFYINK